MNADNEMTWSEIESEDGHNIERRCKNAVRLLNARKHILSENREKFLEFLTYWKAKELQKAGKLF